MGSDGFLVFLQDLFVDPGTRCAVAWRDNCRLIDHRRHENLGVLGERELYGELYATYSNVFKQGWAGGLEPAAVARVIAEALAAEQPEPRYVVGDDAKYMCGVVAAAPAREADAITAGFLANFAKT